MNADYSIVDMLLDPDNESPIACYNEELGEILFDQIAVIPLDEQLYAILKPIDEIEGVGADEALVFLINVEEDTISVVYDFDLCDKVFEVYYDLLEKENM